MKIIKISLKITRAEEIKTTQNIIKKTIEQLKTIYQNSEILLVSSVANLLSWLPQLLNNEELK